MFPFFWYEQTQPGQITKEGKEVLQSIRLTQTGQLVIPTCICIFSRLALYFCFCKPVSSKESKRILKYGPGDSVIVFFEIRQVNIKSYQPIFRPAMNSNMRLCKANNTCVPCPTEAMKYLTYTTEAILPDFIKK
jgi:hypothetical protein